MKLLSPKDLTHAHIDFYYHNEKKTKQINNSLGKWFTLFWILFDRNSINFILICIFVNKVNEMRDLLS